MKLRLNGDYGNKRKEQIIMKLGRKNDKTHIAWTGIKKKPLVIFSRDVGF